MSASNPKGLRFESFVSLMGGGGIFFSSGARLLGVQDPYDLVAAAIGILVGFYFAYKEHRAIQATSHTPALIA